MKDAPLAKHGKKLADMPQANIMFELKLDMRSRRVREKYGTRCRGGHAASARLEWPHVVLCGLKVLQSADGSSLRLLDVLL